ncbi:MAG: hypothetical protein JXR37_32770 [Kiritimatiellae bacterium]|nr:hypothetical protein [Kiritimatiellia bacterium]
MMRTVFQTLGQYLLVLAGGSMGGRALGMVGRAAQAVEGAAAELPGLPAVVNGPLAFGVGLALQEIIFWADRQRRIRKTLEARSAAGRAGSPAPPATVPPAPGAPGRAEPGPGDQPHAPAAQPQQDERQAEPVDPAGGKPPADGVPNDAAGGDGGPEAGSASAPTHSPAPDLKARADARSWPAIVAAVRRLARRADTYAWYAAKVLGGVIAADLLLSSLGPVRYAAGAVGRALGTLPVLGRLAQPDPAWPGRLVLAVLGACLVLAAYRIRNAIERNPHIVARLTVHYRLVPFLHGDFWLSRIPLRKDYAVIKDQGYRFIADCTEVTPGRKRQWFAAVAVPPPLLHQYQDVYYRALEMFDPRGHLDVTAEMSSDTQAETLLAGDGQTAKNICLALDLDNLAGAGTAAKHQVQERSRGTLEKWYAIPVNMIRNVGRLLSKKGLVKLMELGRLFSINGNFIVSEGTAADGRSAKIDLTMNENYVYRLLNLGAPRYDIVEEGNRLIATLTRSPTRRLFTAGVLRDYDVFIMDERYNTDHFKAACTFFVDAIHNLTTLRRNLRWDTELKGIPVDAYQRYAS